ncbi:MAG: threonine ammonia-lyase [Anaerolineales bacterium]
MLTLSSFKDAQIRIESYIKRTPMSLSKGFPVWLKWESHQPTHSFKVRGAINRILTMSPIPRMLITGSAGNHGQAMAQAARIAATEAWVFVPENTPHVKVNRILQLGAKVERVPGLFGDAEAKAIQTARELGVPFISAYNDLAVIAGAGTIALEMLEQVPELERILVPAGGGGLLCGVGLAAKAINPNIEVIGILSEASPYLYHHFYYGDMHSVVEQPTLTDGLAGAVEAGSVTLELLHQACDAIVQVRESDVAAAVAYFYRGMGEVVEGSGAVGLAAVMAGQFIPGQKITGTVVSGGNIDPEKLQQVLASTKELV